MNVWLLHVDDKLVHDDEIVLCARSGVGLYNGDERTQWEDGKLTLSTHNIFFQPPCGNPPALRLPLGLIDTSGREIYSKRRFAFSHAKIVVPLCDEKKNTFVKFSFRNGGMDEFFSAMQNALRAKQWLKGLKTQTRLTATPTKATTQALRVQKQEKEERDGDGGSDAPAAPVFSITDKAGISGLMRVSGESVQLREALRDIDDVMANASSLVASINHLRQKQMSAAGATPSEDETAIESIEATLGLGSMLRTPSSGTSHNRFHEELAKEMHTWMTHEKNEHVFGTMPLVPLIELFSLYNKARGGNDLVSPNDVYLACCTMGKQPYSLYVFKKLSSGRFAMQRKDPSLVLEKLVRVLGPRLCRPAEKVDNVRTGSGVEIVVSTTFPEFSSMLRFINEVEFAALLHVARSVALDLLEELEMHGYLCRSGSGFGCVAFHWNIFLF